MTRVLALKASEDYNRNTLLPSSQSSSRNVIKKEDYESELWEGVRKELGKLVENLVESTAQEGNFSRIYPDRETTVG